MGSTHKATTIIEAAKAYMCTKLTQRCREPCRSKVNSHLRDRLAIQKLHILFEAATANAQTRKQHKRTDFHIESRKSSGMRIISDQQQYNFNIKANFPTREGALKGWQPQTAADGAGTRDQNGAKE